MSARSPRTKNDISTYNFLRSRILENAPVLHGASPRVLYHGYSVFIAREATSSFYNNDPLFRASLATYSGPHRAVETVLLRTSDAKPYVIEAMEDLLEGMEFELGVRLNRCAAGGALNAGAAGLVHGSGSNGQDVANSQSYKAYKKPDDPVQVGYKAYTPRGGTH